MKKLILSLVILLCSCTAVAVRAQDQASVGTTPGATITAPSAIYAEILGSGLIPTINYDRMVADNFSVHAGIGYLPLGTVASDGNGNSLTASITTIPVGVSWFPFGATSSKLEIGVSAFYADLVAKSFSHTAAGNGIGYGGILGYRLEPLDGGFLFRVAITPWDLLGHFQMWGGLSLGWAF